MKQCKKCGKELKEGAVFCAQCGTKQTEDVEQTIERKNESGQTINVIQVPKIEVEGAKANAKRYYKQFLQVLARPRVAITHGETFTYITQVLVILSKILLAYAVIEEGKKLLKRGKEVTNVLFDKDIRLRYFDFEIAMKLFLIIAIIMGIRILITWLEEKHILHQKDTYIDVMGYYAHLMPSIIVANIVVSLLIMLNVHSATMIKAYIIILILVLFYQYIVVPFMVLAAKYKQQKLALSYLMVIDIVAFGAALTILGLLIS